MEFKPIVSYENEIIKNGKDIAVFATGKTVKLALETERVLQISGISPTIINVRFLDKADGELLEELKKEHDIIVTIEESVRTGSYTERLMAEAASRKLNFNFIPITLPDSFIEHGSQKELWERYGFDAGKIAEKIKEEALLKLDAELFRR